MAEAKKLIFNAPDPDAEYKFLGFRTAEGSFVEPETVFFEYRSVAAVSMETSKFRPGCSGVVKPNRKLKRGSVIKNGDEVGEISDCPHQIVMKDLCATCGKDLRIVDEVTGKPKERSSAHVSMVHHVPELVVSKDLANKFGQEDYEKVLKAKKLILLVDLDQTLIHTTNRPVPEKELLPDIYQYLCADGRYYTKLRPHCREFLERMNQLYEMHIISFGQRYYAHKITKILDEDQKYFAQRIMSRDELNSVRHKTNNISALFPILEQRKMIVIIDDRDDVWQYCEALIRVKPYKYFAEVDDINAPTSLKGNEKTEVAEGEDPVNKGEEEAGDKEEKTEKEKEEAPPIASSPALNQDNDDVLEDIGRVLTEVHRAFFEHYEKNKELSDVSGIISYMRKKVLQNEVIALSGLIPMGTDKTRSIVYRLCIQFGATVTDDLTDETTVLIAARPSTEKVRLAIRKKIPIVTLEWLYTCTAKWICVPKRDYQHVGLHLSQFKEKRRQEEAGNQSPRLCGIEALSKEVLKTMEEEVDEELGDLSESSDEEHGSDTSAEDVEILESRPKVERQKEKPASSLEEEEDEDNRSKLLKRLNSQEDSDEEDEVMRNGDIESRTRKRTFESAGMDDEDEGPSFKRMSPDVGELDDDLEAEMQEYEDDSDELEAELENQLNG
ncbi:hypothetical protein FO519_000450 [Halicephalobus sp. NKZ332]|nr:hypothetical protein FO519_000450 [Halicephalobus sp. NKZ332]